MYSISLRVWAEPEDATQREQGHDGGLSSMSPRPAPARLPLICGASLLDAFALASLHFFPGPFHFARFCSFATGRTGAATCRAGCRCTCLASLCLLLLPFMDAFVTFRLLRLADRHFCTAEVRTMPHGIDEAFFPRFFSEEGRQIGPVLRGEGACEVAVDTAIPRAVAFGGKLNDFFAKRCVADKDPLFFLTFEALVIICLLYTSPSPRDRG